MVLNRFKSKLDIEPDDGTLRQHSDDTIASEASAGMLWIMACHPYLCDFERFDMLLHSFPLHALLCRKYLPPNYYETNAAWFEMCACCAKVFACWSCAKEPFLGDRSWKQMIPASSGNEVIFRNLKHSKARKVRAPWFLVGFRMLFACGDISWHLWIQRIATACSKSSALHWTESLKTWTTDRISMDAFEVPIKPFSDLISQLNLWILYE